MGAEGPVGKLLSCVQEKIGTREMEKNEHV